MKYLLAALFVFQLTFAQQTDKVDFLKIEAAIAVDMDKSMVGGQYLATFKARKNADSVYVDAINIDITDVVTKSFDIGSTDDKIWFTGNFIKDSTYVARFWYEAFPNQTVYFTRDQVWTQGQGKYTSHWLPSLDDMNDKIEFDIQYIVPEGKSVVANGKLLDIQGVPEMTAWHFDMEEPMSSYLVAFAVGNFDKITTTSDSGVPIELYYRPEDSLKAEPTYRWCIV